MGLISISHACQTVTTHACGPMGHNGIAYSRTNQRVASVCKVMVNKMGLYKKNTQTLEKLFPGYGMTDLYFSR